MAGKRKPGITSGEYSPSSRARRLCGQGNRGLQLRQKRLNIGKLTLCKGDVQLVGEAALEPRLREGDILLGRFDRLLRDLEAVLKRPDVEIGARHIGDYGDDDRVPEFGHGLGVVVDGFKQAPVLPENIELPRHVEAGHAIDVLKTGGGVACTDRLGDTPLGEVGSRASGVGCTAAHLRERIADSDDLLGPERLYTRQRNFDIGIAFKGALDQPIELGVMEGAPPANGFGLRHVVLGDDSLPSRPIGNGHFNV